MSGYRAYRLYETTMHWRNQNGYSGLHRQSIASINFGVILKPVRALFTLFIIIIWS